MKNIVFIPYIKRKSSFGISGVQKPRWDSGYECGISSWKKWCHKNNCELIIMDELMVPEEEMLITWQRWNVLNLLEHNKVNYDQVLVVDADSIIHPNCPNFFELTNNKFTSQLTDGCFEFVNRAIKGYSQMFFNKYQCLKPYEFFQTGFVIINKNHKKFFDKVFNFYWENKNSIIESYNVIETGSDIALLNCLRKEYNVELNILPREFSIMDIARKNLLYFDNRQWWEDDMENLFNSGWIYQFNSIPENSMNRDRKYWMERVYKELGI
tara:strand:+ start:1975 stop:2778 length:804 start_codon:yes stop_codon:yes gene_type:complete